MTSHQPSDQRETAEGDRVMSQLPSDLRDTFQHDIVTMSQPPSDLRDTFQHDIVTMSQPPSDLRDTFQHDIVTMSQPQSGGRKTAQYDAVMMLKQPSEPLETSTVKHNTLTSEQPSGSRKTSKAEDNMVTMSEQLLDPREIHTVEDNTVTPEQPSDQRKNRKVEDNSVTMSEQLFETHTVQGELDDFQDCKEADAPLRLTRPQGSVKWTGNNSAMTCTWLIDVTSSGLGGMVLQFHEVHLLRGTKATDDDTVVMLRFRPNNGSQEVSRVQGSLPVSPVLVHSQTALVIIEAYEHDYLQTEELISQTRSSVQSRFHLSYKAYSSDSLPPRLSNGRSNCSQPYDVPEALRCDMVEQCENGEDERNYNCSYLHPDCDDWIPLGNLCIKFVFPDHPVSPLTARVECNKLGVGILGLAALHDADAKVMAANVTSLSGHHNVIVGLEKMRVGYDGLSRMYRFLWVWGQINAVEFEGPAFGSQGPTLNCATLRIYPVPYFNPVMCARKLRAGYACMRTKKGYVTHYSRWIIPASNFSYPPVSKPMHHNIPVKKCSDGSFVPVFGHCARSFTEDVMDQPASQVGPKRRFFECLNERTVHYTLTCDGYDDCGDRSDEMGCILAFHLSVSEQLFGCKESAELILAELRCDGKADCRDESDEKVCEACRPGMAFHPLLDCLPQSYTRRSGLQENHLPTLTNCADAIWLEEYNDDALRKIRTSVKPTETLRIVTLDGYGMVERTVTAERTCPETHVMCPKGLCIPSVLVGNGEHDCPFPVAADERHDYENPCPGYYRCYRTPSICLHPDYVCDGVYHCPRKDDERFCNLTCPPGCTCEALHYTCNQTFNPQRHWFVRYLDISHVSQPALDLNTLFSLWFLNLSSCDFNDASLPRAVLSVFLRVLDVSFNRLISSRSVGSNAFWLTHLNLSGNPLVTHLSRDYAATLVFIPRELLSLSLAGTTIQRMDRQAFEPFTSLKYLDISGNRVTRFESGIFDGLESLKRLKADSQRLCCVYARQYPQIKITCDAPEDELSSCEDLLRSYFLRVTLWLQSLMAVVGNVGVFVFRVFIESHTTSSSFRVLVANLCVADLLMGVYMILIGAADARYTGQFLWEKDAWTESDQCKAAGFLALLSSEVSAFIICLITVDRFLLLRFPFRPHSHLTCRSAMLACAAAWTIGVLLALVPLLPFTQHWEFYSQTSICLPLPITRQQFPGQTYSFSIFIGLNFALFLLIGAGQLSIYRAVHNTPMAGRTQNHQQDAAVARRLFLVVFTDFCCWFPVGVMGLLAARGTPIPGEVNVVTAVFVLPLNSALNPFLYTLNTVLERRVNRKEQERMQNMMNKLQTELSTWPYDKLAQLVRCGETAMRHCQPRPEELVSQSVS